MASRTTRELLHEIKDFHGLLAKFYTASVSKVDRDRVKPLLEYMGRHERRLEDCLAKYEETAAKRVLDTWFAFPPDIVECALFDGVSVTQDTSVDDIIQMTLELDDCLVRFFKRIAELAVSDDVRELSTNLATMEEQEEGRVARVALELT